MPRVEAVSMPPKTAVPSARRLAAPAPLAAPDISRRTLSFQWQPVTGASRYRFQLAEDPEFKQLKPERTVDTPGVELPRPMVYRPRKKKAPTAMRKIAAPTLPSSGRVWDWDSYLVISPEARGPFSAPSSMKTY